MGEEKRRSAVFFCVDVDHCNRVSDELERHGINAPTITGKTKHHVRDRLIQNFKDQKIRAICCINVLTEGFDAPHIDTIILLRPTLSAGLFSQMVGRGLRIWHQKDYCLVLDFAGCIDEHGPLDLLGTGQEVVMATCGDCRESFSRIVRVCPSCGWEIPKREIERLEAEEAERRMHTSKASRKAILSHSPEPVEVHNVFVARHKKPGSPDSIKVTYRCGNETVNEWVCLDHPGHAGRLADRWWKTRFGGPRKAPSVDEALDLILVQAIKDWTHTITFKKDGKYKKIIAYNNPMETADVL
jgi:DNA repair protein RadD